jgi:cytochrome P450
MARVTFTNDLPGPAPVVGLGREGNYQQFAADPIVYMRHLYENYGQLAGLTHRDEHLIFAFGPQYVRRVVTDSEGFRVHESDQFPEDTSIQRLNSGVGAMNPPRHAQHRRLLSPMFHRRHIAESWTRLVEIVQNHIRLWRVGDLRDLQEEMRRLVPKLSMGSFLGVASETRSARIYELMERSIQTFSLDNPVLQAALPDGSYEGALEVFDALEAEIHAVLREEKVAAPGNSASLLAQLLAAHEQGLISDIELVAHTNTLVLGGHITMSISLTWLFFLLAYHHQVGRDLLDELHGALRGAAPTVQSIDSLPLLDAVVKECLRVLPPFMWGIRISTTQFTLGQSMFGANTDVVWSPYITHRMRELYEDPDRFIPTRWFGISPSPYEYLPFGGGAHRCPGSEFARLTMKLIVATIWPQYRLQLPDRLPIERAGGSLGRAFALPKHGIPIVLKHQDCQGTESIIEGNINQLIDLA